MSIRTRRAKEQAKDQAKQQAQNDKLAQINYDEQQKMRFNPAYKFIRK